MSDDLEFVDKNKPSTDKSHASSSKDAEITKQPGVKNVEIQKRTNDEAPREARKLLKKVKPKKTFLGLVDDLNEESDHDDHGSDDDNDVILGPREKASERDVEFDSIMNEDKIHKNNKVNRFAPERDRSRKQPSSSSAKRPTRFVEDEDEDEDIPQRRMEKKPSVKLPPPPPQKRKIDEYDDQDKDQDDMYSDEGGESEEDEYEAELKKKRELLLKLESLRIKGEYVPDEPLSELDPLDKIKFEYDRLTDGKRRIKAHKMMRSGLTAAAVGMEKVLDEKNGFIPLLGLEGFADSTVDSIEDYDDIFDDLYDKYKDKANYSPELRLVFWFGYSAVQFHLTKRLENLSSEDTIKLANNMMEKNPQMMETIMTNMMNKMAQNQQSPMQNQNQQPQTQSPRQQPAASQQPISFNPHINFNPPQQQASSSSSRISEIFDPAPGPSGPENSRIPEPKTRSITVDTPSTGKRGRKKIDASTPEPASHVVANIDL